MSYFCQQLFLFFRNLFFEVSLTSLRLIKFIIFTILCQEFFINSLTFIFKKSCIVRLLYQKTFQFYHHFHIMSIENKKSLEIFFFFIYSKLFLLYYVIISLFVCELFYMEDSFRLFECLTLIVLLHQFLHLFVLLFQYL